MIDDSEISTHMADRVEYRIVYDVSIEDVPMGTMLETRELVNPGSVLAPDDHGRMSMYLRIFEQGAGGHLPNLRLQSRPVAIWEDTDPLPAEVDDDEGVAP